MSWVSTTWFPVVTASRQNRKVSSVKAGVPHCPQCAVPLILVRGEWNCTDCGAKRPESLADLMVVDSIVKEALKQFLQRRRGYRAEGSTKV
jgi:ribosomal protein L37AE/L43A